MPRRREQRPNGPIVVVDDFVKARECARMLEETNRGDWFRSAVEAVDGSRTGGGARTSESLLLPTYSAWARAWFRSVERRLASQLDIDPARLEPWQIVRYRRGERYDYHLDSGAWAGHPSGERERTILIVLEAPERGGATHFRALARSIPARAGRLMVWPNLLASGHSDHAMIHSGRPVWRGRKTIVTTWQRQRTYVEIDEGDAMAARKDDRIVREIIKRYGSTLDLKEGPHVILEIIRQYGARVAGPVADCQPPGGPPPKRFDPIELARELNMRIAEVTRLSAMLEKAVKPKTTKAVPPKRSK